MQNCKPGTLGALQLASRVAPRARARRWLAKTRIQMARTKGSMIVGVPFLAQDVTQLGDD
jgi:hypothetical protein